MAKHSMNPDLARRLLDDMTPSMRRTLFPKQTERCQVCRRERPLKNMAYTITGVWACRKHPGILDIEVRE